MKYTHIKHFSFILTSLTLPIVGFAGSEYVPITEGGIPLVDPATMNMSQLLNTLFAVSVGIAAILAVVMLAVGGFQYMTSESVFKMGNAKEHISNAIIGLLIVLFSILILATINSDIVALNLF